METEVLSSKWAGRGIRRTTRSPLFGVSNHTRTGGVIPGSYWTVKVKFIHCGVVFQSSDDMCLDHQ